MYQSILKPLLFKLNAEKAHHLTFNLLSNFLAFSFVKSLCKANYTLKNERLKKELFGISFPNPVGLAAGFDKDAKLYDELNCFGFGFIEIGTLTPLPQEGNPKPRLFRLPKDHALINRMGFNNGGVEAAVERLKNRNTSQIIGGNIGKNKVTPNENALNDYLNCFHALFDVVDYFVVNVSSPNTPNLRALQEKKPLTELLTALQVENKKKAKSKPILLKIAPDLTNEQLQDIIDIVNDTRLNGVIATNTTIDRSKLTTDVSVVESMGAGGLSGRPVRQRSTEVIRFLAEKSNKSFAIIAVGGIFTAEDAVEKLEAGADLLQIYTGFIYEGPGMVKRINKGILEYYARKQA